MEHKITIMKYQTMFPGMTKKLFDEKERFYQIAVISIELFGWFFEMDEEKQVLDGTSELFAPAEEK